MLIHVVYNVYIFCCKMVLRLDPSYGLKQHCFLMSFDVFCLCLLFGKSALLTMKSFEI